MKVMHCPKFLARDRVDSRGRLIQQQDHRFMNQRTAQRQFLFHPAGAFPCAAGFERLDLLVYVFHQMVILTYGRTEQRGKKVQVLLHRQVGIQGKPARHITDASPQLAVVPHNVQPVHRNPPALRTQQSGQHAEQRAFPGSVRSYQSEDFSGPDLERNVVQSLYAAVMFGHALYLHNGFHDTLVEFAFAIHAQLPQAVVFHGYFHGVHQIRPFVTRLYGFRRKLGLFG